MSDLEDDELVSEVDDVPEENDMTDITTSVAFDATPHSEVAPANTHVSDKVDLLVSSLQDTNRNLKSMDKLLSAYRETTDANKTSLEKLQSDVAAVSQKLSEEARIADRQRSKTPPVENFMDRERLLQGRVRSATGQQAALESSVLAAQSARAMALGLGRPGVLAHSHSLSSSPTPLISSAVRPPLGQLGLRPPGLGVSPLAPNLPSFASSSLTSMQPASAFLPAPVPGEFDPMQRVLRDLHSENMRLNSELAKKALWSGSEGNLRDAVNLRNGNSSEKNLSESLVKQLESIQGEMHARKRATELRENESKNSAIGSRVRRDSAPVPGSNGPLSDALQSALEQHRATRPPGEVAALSGGHAPLSGAARMVASRPLAPPPSPSHPLPASQPQSRPLALGPEATSPQSQHYAAGMSSIPTAMPALEDTFTRSRLAQLESHKHSLELELETMKRKLDLSEGSKQTLTREIQDLRAAQTQVEREKDNLKSQFEEFKAEMDKRSQKQQKLMEGERADDRRVFERHVEELLGTMSTKSTQHSHTLEDLRRERDRLEMTRTQLTDQVQRQSRELEAKDAQVSKLMRELQDAMGRGEQFERGQFEASSQLALVKREHDELRLEKDRAAERARVAEAARDEHARRANEIKAKAQEAVKLWKSKTERLETELNLSRTSSTDTAQRFEKTQRELETLRQYSSQLLAQIEHMREEMNELLAIRSRQEELMRKKEEEIDAAGADRVRFEAEMDSLKKTIEKLEQQRAAETHSTAAEKEERVRLEEQLAAAEATRGILDTQLKELQQEFRQSSAEKTQILALNQDLTGKINELSQVNATLKSRETSLSEELGNVSRQLTEEKKAHSFDVSQLSKELEQLKKREHDAIEQLNSQLKLSSLSTQEQVEKLLTEQREMKRQLALSQRQCEQLKTDMVTLHDYCLRCKEEYGKLQRKYLQSKELLKNNTSRTSDHEEKGKQLSEELLHVKSTVKELEAEKQHLMDSLTNELNSLIEASGLIDRAEMISLAVKKDSGSWVTEFRSKMGALRIELDHLRRAQQNPNLSNPSVALRNYTLPMPTPSANASHMQLAYPVASPAPGARFLVQGNGAPQTYIQMQPIEAQAPGTLVPSPKQDRLQAGPALGATLRPLPSPAAQPMQSIVHSTLPIPSIISSASSLSAPVALATSDQEIRMLKLEREIEALSGELRASKESSVSPQRSPGIIAASARTSFSPSKVLESGSGPLQIESRTQLGGGSTLLSTPARSYLPLARSRSPPSPEMSATNLGASRTREADDFALGLRASSLANPSLRRRNASWDEAANASLTGSGSPRPPIAPASRVSALAVPELENSRRQIEDAIASDMGLTAEERAQILARSTRLKETIRSLREDVEQFSLSVDSTKPSPASKYTSPGGESSLSKRVATAGRSASPFASSEPRSAYLPRSSAGTQLSASASLRAAPGARDRFANGLSHTLASSGLHSSSNPRRQLDFAH